jgi:hypothetical protein
VANAKQPLPEISRRGRFVTATTRSAKWRIAMMRNSRRGCWRKWPQHVLATLHCQNASWSFHFIATTRCELSRTELWKKVSVNEPFTSSVMYWWKIHVT